MLSMEVSFYVMFKAFAPLPCNIKIKIILCCIKTAFIHMQVFNTLTYSILKSRRTLHIAQMANPKTVTMQYVDLFSHLTAQLPFWKSKEKGEIVPTM